MTQTAVDGIPATRARGLAGITYRQLDHWARRGWVRPSVDVGLGRAGRRLYGPADVVRLGALGHFGAAGLDVGKLGPVLADLDIDSMLELDFLIAADGCGTVTVVRAEELRGEAAQLRPRVFFDPADLRAALGVVPAAPQLPRREVRSA